MTITKYEHSCLSIEEQGSRLIIDPGVWSSSLTDLTNIIGVVITHEHGDHFNKPLLARIVGANPQATIYTVGPVADQLHNYKVEVPVPGTNVLIGPFQLSFYAQQHQQIHPMVPICENIGVLVNDTLFYPGDSFVNPYKPIDILAVPAAAPWMKVAEAMNYIIALRPRLVFPTHNAVLSDVGATVQDVHLSRAAEKAGSTYQTLAVGETLKA